MIWKWIKSYLPYFYSFLKKCATYHTSPDLLNSSAVKITTALGTVLFLLLFIYYCSILIFWICFYFYILILVILCDFASCIILLKFLFSYIFILVLILIFLVIQQTSVFCFWLSNLFWYLKEVLIVNVVCTIWEMYEREKQKSALDQ